MQEKYVSCTKQLLGRVVAWIISEDKIAYQQQEGLVWTGRLIYSDHGPFDSQIYISSFILKLL